MTDKNMGGTYREWEVRQQQEEFVSVAW